MAKSREKEAKLIRDSNAASAAGRLLLGEISSWHEFLEPDTTDYAALPRKQLKGGKLDIQKNRSREIEKFCKDNFLYMSQEKLLLLYEDVKAHQGLELPYTEFSKRYSPVKNFDKKGYPYYSTVCISLWGMQYRFPEHDFSNDLCTALEKYAESLASLNEYKQNNHKTLSENREKLICTLRILESSKRQVMQTCFSLLECVLNGLAWKYLHENDISQLCERQRKLRDNSSNATLREKIQKYPKIIFKTDLTHLAGSTFWILQNHSETL